MAELSSPSRVRAMDLLPDDLLADVLARLPPCSLAASRCVRKHWCAIIDTRRLLRADLLPLRLDGFFCGLAFPRHCDDDATGLFFARPSTACRISADHFMDHCNGLLLLWNHVFNPATRQWVPLPPFPEITMAVMEDFDRITLQNDKYQMIKSPAENQHVSYLGKCERGVHFGLLLSEENMWPRFRAWLLNESCGQMEWVLKNDISLQAVVENYFQNVYTDRYSTPWIVTFQEDDDDDLREVQPEDEPDWDFDSGIVLHEIKDKVSTDYVEMFFLGFHPYKEIAFFLVGSRRVLSYHLNTSKVQELGILNESIKSSFPYTPCWMKLFENN